MNIPHNPLNAGILALETYVPSFYVSQEEMEQYHNISSGKLTKGLGQLEMGFCGDREDVNSLCLNAVSNLLKTHSIPPSQIGRLSVGTESSVDKSKSVKSVLMRLFTASSNTNIEGCDVINACYGATQALFDSIAWVESSSWDGRFAVVVAADIAVYEEGPARPTGGAGAVAVLIGPNAPLVISPVRYAYSSDAHDFYKPQFSSEYPVVNGKTSIDSYLEALSSCWTGFKERFYSRYEEEITMNGIDYFLFHAPFHKMVIKAVNKLIELEKEAGVEINDENELFASKVMPGQLLCQRVGNMYTASIFGALASLLSNRKLKFKEGQRIAMFSYGSGLCSSMYMFTLQKPNDLFSFSTMALDLEYRLSTRELCSPEKFHEVLKCRDMLVRAVEYDDFTGYSPVQTEEEIPKGAYYLDFIDGSRARSYTTRV
ncbi:hypothetical protein GEMRC1_006691 [Eukaryota sp. GEM-RC1]